MNLHFGRKLFGQIWGVNFDPLVECSPPGVSILFSFEERKGEQRVFTTGG
jgi:hypothetical protein